MTILLDTHVFIWFDSNSPHLSARATALIADPANQIFLSVGSVWELVIKSQIGKLILRNTVETIVNDQCARNAIQLLDVKATHVYAVGTLPAVHKDPFDRLLAAQAITEGATLLTADPIFGQYPVQTDW